MEHEKIGASWKSEKHVPENMTITKLLTLGGYRDIVRGKRIKQIWERSDTYCQLSWTATLTEVCEQGHL